MTDLVKQNTTVLRSKVKESKVVPALN
jgi:hypothetical protein